MLKVQGWRKWIMRLGEMSVLLGVVGAFGFGIQYVVTASVTAANAKGSVEQLDQKVGQMAQDVAYTRGRVDAIADRLKVPKQPKEKNDGTDR